MRIITLLYYISFKRIIITEYIPINFELLVKRLVTSLSPFIIIFFNIYIHIRYTGMMIVYYISVII